MKSAKVQQVLCHEGKVLFVSTSLNSFIPHINGLCLQRAATIHQSLTILIIDQAVMPKIYWFHPQMQKKQSGDLTLDFFSGFDVL